jgi:hypothetical protein
MKRRQKPKRKLSPFERRIVAAASMPAPEARKVLASLLAKPIFPPRPAKPKVTPQFLARFMAYHASEDLRRFAGVVRNAALNEDKLFFKYLAEYLRKKPIRLPISEEQRRLLHLHYQNLGLSASEAIERLDWKGGKGNYRAEKKRALERAKLMQRAWREGWSGLEETRQRWYQRNFGPDKSVEN